MLKDCLRLGKVSSQEAAYAKSEMRYTMILQSNLRARKTGKYCDQTLALQFRVSTLTQC